jgi:4-hydroxy-tetrahydrodipicolinate synthase
MTRKLYDLTMARKLDEALLIQYDLVTLFDAMIYHSEFPDGFRAGASLRGFNLGKGRQPLSDKQTSDLSALRNTIQCLLSRHGFTDEPGAGCPIQPRAVSTDVVRGDNPTQDVSDIVRSVVAELKKKGLM